MCRAVSPTQENSICAASSPPSSGDLQTVESGAAGILKSNGSRRSRSPGNRSASPDFASAAIAGRGRFSDKASQAIPSKLLFEGILITASSSTFRHASTQDSKQVKSFSVFSAPSLSFVANQFWFSFVSFVLSAFDVDAARVRTTSGSR
jgi:hypothetical protein